MAQPAVTTLGSAWVEFKKRDDLRPRTRKLYEDTYDRCLKQWEREPLATLAANPVMARDEHRALSKKRGPRTANMALSQLRAIHRHAARLDTSLSFERHPCTAVEFHDEKPRQNAAIPAELMPAWGGQLTKLRALSPLRASFQILNLRFGTRPGELAARQWSDLDWDRNVLTLAETKTGLYEAPLCRVFKAVGQQPRQLMTKVRFCPRLRCKSRTTISRRTALGR